MDSKLTTQDLAQALVERYGMEADAAESFINTVFEIIEEYIFRDKVVRIKGLGTFKLVSVSQRESVNVNTGERILIAGHSKLSFTPDNALKDIVNKPFADFETVVLKDTTSTEEMERIAPMETVTPDSEEANTDSSADNAEADDSDAALVADNSLVAEPVQNGSEEELATTPDIESNYAVPADNISENASHTHGSSITQNVSHHEEDDIPGEENSAQCTEDGIQCEGTPISTEIENTSASHDAPLQQESSQTEQSILVDNDADDTDVSYTESADSVQIIEAEEFILHTQDTSVVTSGHNDTNASDIDDTSVQKESLSQKENLYPMASAEITRSSQESSKHVRRWVYVFLTILLMAVSYICGHYQILGKIEINLYPEEQIAQDATMQESSSHDGLHVSPLIVVDTLQQIGDSTQTHTEPADTTVVTKKDTIVVAANKTTVSEEIPIVSAEQMEEDPAEIAKFFPQVKNGSYWIVGDAGRIHYMESGETLYRVAKKELGSQDFVRYIIVFNKFEDPNLIHTGDPIRIPKLVKKDSIISSPSI